MAHNLTPEQLEQLQLIKTFGVTDLIEIINDIPIHLLYLSEDTLPLPKKEEMSLAIQMVRDLLTTLEK